MKPAIALIHSPLVGPMTWSPVTQTLRQIGFESVVPPLTDQEGSDDPYWKQHSEAVARHLERFPENRPLVLVGHSGAGALLPAIGAALPQVVAGYIFVDAGLPHPGLSRLDDMRANAPEFGEDLRAHLEAGGRFPEWTDDDLREIVPDNRRRRDLLAELHPRPLAFFEENMPEVNGWPDTSCGYIRFSEGYAAPGAQAQRNGWAYREFDAEHFHMLVDPETVAGGIIDLVRSLSAAAQNGMLSGGEAGERQ